MKCNSVAIIGAPNVGKSTLINSLLGMKISSVSRKRNMTRRVLLGATNIKDAMIEIYDTPGIHKTAGSYQKAMVRASSNLVPNVRTMIMIVSLKNLREDWNMIKHFLDPGKKIMILANKTDIASESEIEEFQSIVKTTGFPYLLISAAKRGNLEIIKSMIYDYSDSCHCEHSHSQKEMLATIAEEMTIEQIYDLIHGEVPYDCCVRTEKLEKKDDGSIIIRQTIFTKKESQVSILVGAGGELIKTLGIRARAEITKSCGSEVHLMLEVHHDENWQRNAISALSDSSLYQSEVIL